MKTTTCLCILALLLLPTAPTGGQATSSAGFLHAEIQKVYDFHPHTLSSAQITQKSGLLDQFWIKAKSQRDVYVPELRRELADFSNPPFFLFDGSQLLLSLSDAPADRKIVLSAIVHTDLRDLQLKDYFLLVQRMATQGEDTTAAAFHILPEPKFQVFIPQHSLTLAQDYCLVYMLLPTNQGFWVQPAIERLRAETDVTAQKSLLLLLWYAQQLIPTKLSVNFRPPPLSPKPQKPMQMNWSIGRTALAEPTQLAPRRAKNLYSRLDASE
jgi:hypothetical protein